jgi:hypothetical protein
MAFGSSVECENNDDRSQIGEFAFSKKIGKSIHFKKNIKKK